MAFARVTLFDLDDSNPADPAAQPEPTGATFMEYDPDNFGLGQKGLKVTITVGDDVSGSSLTVPFGMLSALMADAMSQHERQKMLKGPGLILPHGFKPN